MALAQYKLTAYATLLLVTILLSACGRAPYSSAIDNLVLPSYKEQGETVKERLLLGLSKDSPAPSSGEALEEITLSLQGVVFSVLKNNSDIRIASHRTSQAQADISQAVAPYDPELFAEWEYNYNSNPTDTVFGKSNDKYYNNTERVGLRQLTPTGGIVSVYREWTNGVEWALNSAKERRRAGGYVVELTQPLLRGIGNQEVKTNIEISKLQLGISYAEFKQTMTASLQDAFDTYWNVALSRKEIIIYEETLGMAKTLLSREKTRQHKGLSTELDVERAKEAVATRTINLLNAREQQHIYQEQLKFILNSSGMKVGSATIILANENLETPIVRPNVERSMEIALQNRPEILQAALSIEAGKYRQKFARHNLLPRLDLVSSIRENDSDAHGNVAGYGMDTLGTDWAVGLLFSIPLGNTGARAETDRAEAELQQSVETMDSTQDRVIAEVKIAAQSIGLIAQEITQSKLAVQAARRVVDGELARFELNQVGNRDLLQSQDLLAVSERSHIQALIRYNNAIVQLLAAEGTLLEHLGIVVDLDPQ